MNLTPPQAPPLWRHRAADITMRMQESITEYLKVMDKVGALAPQDCNFKSVFYTLQEAETRLNCATGPLTFYKNVSPIHELRDASYKAEALVCNVAVETSMRIDVFNSKVAAEKNIKESGHREKLTLEERRLVEKMMLDGTRAGLALSEAKRKDIMGLRQELSEVCQEINRNSDQENGIISFTEEELKGVPEDIISGYTKCAEGGKMVYNVTFKNPDISPVAKKPETRKRAWEAHEDRLSVNAPLLEKVLKLRRNIAILLGYNSWADYITEVNMIKSSKNVQDFLDDIEKKVLPVGMKDKDALLAIKEKEHQAKNIPFDGQLYEWDDAYCSRKFVKDTLNLDDLLVRNYFPASVAIPNILKFYQNLFGVQFRDIENPSTWHDDVQAFEVWEKDAKNESDFIGYCYLDLVPRANKFSDVAIACSILPGYELPKSRQHKDYTRLWNDMREKVSLVKYDKACAGQGAFGHITGGYDARYYVYMYARVFAADMYATVFKDDPLDPARGKLYRDKILKVGGSREELDSLKDLLGREPSNNAFMHEISEHAFTSIQ